MSKPTDKKPATTPVDFDEREQLPPVPDDEVDITGALLEVVIAVAAIVGVVALAAWHFTHR
jgi:hypothetical protein